MKLEYEIEKKIQKGRITIEELNSLTREQAIEVLKIISQRVINNINAYEIMNEYHTKS